MFGHVGARTPLSSTIEEVNSSIQRMNDYDAVQ